MWVTMRINTYEISEWCDARTRMITESEPQCECNFSGKKKVNNNQWRCGKRMRKKFNRWNEDAKKKKMKRRNQNLKQEVFYTK